MKCEVNHPHASYLLHWASQANVSSCLRSVPENLGNLHFLKPPLEIRWLWPLRSVTISIASCQERGENCISVQGHQEIMEVQSENMTQCTENISHLCLQNLWSKSNKDLVAVCCLQPRYLRRSMEKIQISFHRRALFKSRVPKDKSTHTLPAGSAAQELCQVASGP